LNGWRPYDQRAAAFAAQYEGVTFEQIHRTWLRLLPSVGRALDVGAGSGRDAAALAELGWTVTAVEPSALLAEARRRHPGLGIEWIEDHLPALSRVSPTPFDLVLANAVWMHIPADDAETAFGALADRLAPGGRLVITYRTSSVDASRGMRSVDERELPSFAAGRGLSPLDVIDSHDAHGRDAIRWRTLVWSR